MYAIKLTVIEIMLQLHLATFIRFNSKNIDRWVKIVRTKFVGNSISYKFSSYHIQSIVENNRVIQE